MWVQQEPRAGQLRVNTRDSLGTYLCTHRTPKILQASFVYSPERNST